MPRTAPAAPPVPVEVIATAVVAIAEGVKRLRAGPLNDRALLILIQHAIPSSASNGPVPIKTIRAVLDGIESMGSEYIRKVKP